MENRTIALNEKTIAALNELQKAAMEAQNTITSVKSRLTDIVTGLCLSADLELSEYSITLSADLTELVLTPLKAKETKEAAVPRNTIKARRKKM